MKNENQLDRPFLKNHFKLAFVLCASFAVLLLAFFWLARNTFAAGVISDRGTSVLPDLESSSDFARDLPSGDLTTSFLPAAIKIILSIFSLVIGVVLIYVGVVFVVHYGNDEALSKAKKIFAWTIMGMTFVLLAFAIVWGVTHISFNRVG